MGIWPNSTGMVPGKSSTKTVQMVLIGCWVGHTVRNYVFKIQFKKIFLSERTRPRAFKFDVILYNIHLEVLYQYLVDNISGSLEMAPLIPLTFSSGERPRVLSALLLKLSVSNLTLWFGIYFFASTSFWSNLICLMAGITIQRHFLWLQPLVNGNAWGSSNLQVKFY